MTWQFKVIDPSTLDPSPFTVRGVEALIVLSLIVEGSLALLTVPLSRLLALSEEIENVPKATASIISFA